MYLPRISRDQNKKKRFANVHLYTGFGLKNLKTSVLNAADSLQYLNNKCLYSFMKVSKKWYSTFDGL